MSRDKYTFFALNGKERQERKKCQIHILNTAGWSEEIQVKHERDKERQRERDTHTQTNRHTDRHTDK